MGFNKDRGDTLNVVNSPFAGPEKETIVEVPFWKQPETIQLAKELGKYLLIAAVFAYLFFGYLKPMLYKIMGKDVAEEKAKKEAEEAEKLTSAEKELQQEEDDDTYVNLSSEEEIQAAKQGNSYELTLDMAKELAKNDPRIVANVIKTWINNE